MNWSNVGVLVLSFFLASTLNAQQEKRSRPVRDRIMKKFDVDKNGRLSPDERKALREHLSSMNRDQPATIDPDESELYKVADGPFQVQRQRLLLKWNGKDELEVQVSFPEAPESTTNSVNPNPDERQFPVVVFSHGAGGSADAYLPLIEHWTSHGYICIQPTHGDSLKKLKDGVRDRTVNLKEYLQNTKLGQYRVERALQVKWIIDHLDSIEDQVDGLKQRMEKQSIAMAGHSYGAMTTAMIGGLQSMPKDNEECADDRPVCLLMISPQGKGGLLNDDSWNKIQQPTMIVTGSRDGGKDGQDPSWRLDPWNHIPAKTKYLAFIQDGAHSFGGIAGTKYPGSGGNNPDHVYMVKSATVAFLDARLKHSKDATQYLARDQFDGSVIDP